jgi:hypothetical protein
MTKKADKELEGPIVDFDTDDYDSKDGIEVSRPSVTLVSNEPKDLLLYFAGRFKECHGYEYVVSWVKEIAIFKSFMDRYGEDAGPMVELLFDKYSGVVNNYVMTVTAFSRGSKWIQDKLYIELQQSRKQEAEKPSVEGLMSSNDFLSRFSVG